MAIKDVYFLPKKRGCIPYAQKNEVVQVCAARIAEQELHCLVHDNQHIFKMANPICQKK